MQQITNIKGMVLVTVLMVTTILSLLIVGLMPLVGGSTRVIQQDLERHQLFYAAEGGLRSMYSNLSRLGTIESLLKEESKADIGNGKSIEINGVTVKLTADYSNSLKVWNLTSTASKNGKSCIIKVDNIAASSVLSNALAFSSQMLGTSAWTGKVTQNSDGKLLREATTDHFRGKTYFGGKFHIRGTPWFQGNCTYSQNSTSQYTSNIAADKSWFENSGQNGGLKYNKGISDGLYETFHGVYGDKNVYSGGYSSDLAMKDRYSKIFDGGSYSISDAPISFSKSLYKWNELSTNAAKGLKVNNKSISEDLTITFIVDKDGNKKAILKGGGSETNNKEIDLSHCNVLKIANSNGSTVKISGVIDSDITLAIEKGTVQIVGDIYYKGFEAYKDLSQEEILAENDNKVEEMRNALSSSTNKAMFGLINYDGNILIDNEQNKDYAKGSGVADKDDKALLVMGALYTENGQFGAQSTADGAYPNIGSMIAKGALQVVNIGSVVAAQKAYYKIGVNGMASHLNSDLRFEKGFKPKGFPASKKEYSTGSNSYDLFMFGESEMSWSIEWK